MFRTSRHAFVIWLAVSVSVTATIQFPKSASSYKASSGAYREGAVKVLRGDRAQVYVRPAGAT